MSKVDAQRAMRETRYARTAARIAERSPAGPRDDSVEAPSPAPRKGRSTEAPPARSTAVARPEAKAAAKPEANVELCGHRSMNGRTCTRQAAHPEKNHRYGQRHAPRPTGGSEPRAAFQPAVPLAR